MRTHIDWLTFTMPMIYSEGNDDGYANAIERAFMETFGEDLVSAVFGGTWSKKERSRAPYTDAWADNEGGISLFAAPSLTHCCVEISGSGCERLLLVAQLINVLKCCYERVTRIDIATDIETSTQPSEFVSIISHERMRANGTQNSETGQTCYVGSQKSDRYARVYRYYEPHPRAHLLRVEHVFRRDYAKKVAKECLENDISAIAKSAGKAFGWAHSEWDITGNVFPDLSIVSDAREGGKTLAWLVRSVAPAIRKLISNGTIRDPDEFFERYFKRDPAIDA